MAAQAITMLLARSHPFEERNGSEGPVGPADKPAEAESNRSRRARVALDIVAERVLDGARHFTDGGDGIAGGVDGLPVEILGTAFGLFHSPLDLRLGVAGRAPEPLLQPPAQLLGSSADAIFVHGKNSERAWLIRFAKQALTTSADDSNQDTDADGDGEHRQGSLFGLGSDPLQSVVAYPGPNLECLVPEIRRLVGGRPSTTTELSGYLAQDRPDRIANLASRRRRSIRGAATGPYSHCSHFPLDGA
jgi:hypothetical protein